MDVFETYQANCASRLGESEKNVDRRIQPFCPSIVATTGLIYPLYLLLKDSKNIGGGFAALELGGEWMSEEIVLGALVINFQRIVDY